MMKAFHGALAATAFLTLVNCSGARSLPLPDAAVDSARKGSLLVRTPLKHLVIVVQENRSFDNFFVGYPGTDYKRTGDLHTGKQVTLAPVDFSGVGLSHGYKGAMNDWDNGRNDGFDIPPIERIRSWPLRPHTYPYSYVQRPLIKPYWDMAEQYVLSDHMFATEWGPSFTAHQMLIAGTTQVRNNASIVDLPSHAGNCDAPSGTTTNLITNRRVYLASKGPFPCLEYATIADELDQANVSWKYYYATSSGSATLWNAFEAIKKIRYGPDWANVIESPTQVLTDAQNGNLPSVSWVIPDFTNSDHPGAGSDTGPSWVASVVNAIGEGPDWNTTAIVVVWDDWGGWYDNVSPPQLDYRGLGFRVPCLIISPYAKKGYVSHTQYEFASPLKTAEQIFGLNSIGTTDVRANSMLDAFDFTQAPRAFVPINAKYSRAFFLSQKPSGLPVDTE